MSHSSADPITLESLMPPRLLVERACAGHAAGQRHVIDGVQLLLGRDGACDVRFDEAGVSRRHATITRSADGRWTVADQGSTNGTWLNGRRVNQSGLRDGDELRLGPNVVLRFVWGSAEQPAAVDPSIAASQVALWQCDLASWQLTWSEAFDRMLDLAPGTLSNAPLSLEQAVAVEDVPRLRAALLLASRGSPMDLELSTAVGQRRLELRGELVPGTSGSTARIAGSAWDITARHRQTQGLRRHAALFESFSDAVALLDLEGRVLDCNSATLRLFGAPKEAIVGRTLDSSSHPEWTATALDRVRRLGRFEGEWRQEKRSGQDTCCEVVVSPLLDERGGPLGFVVVYRDITETKALQARLVLADRLTAMGTLAAGIAHEINNPLSYLRANLDHILASFSGVGPELSDTVRDCAEGVDRITRIVRDLKFFSHGGTSEPGPTDVANAVSVACKMAEPMLRHRAQLEVQVGELPLARADEGRLAQVLLNLLINAVQAMPEGTDANRISVRAAQEAGGVLVEVSDNGVGMTPEVLRRVFDPFFTTKATGIGSGLGLAICHGIIEGFGGTISARSAVGKGTTFRVWLNQSTESLPEPAEKSPVAPALPPLKVLVVDDEPRVVTALARMLGGQHQVTCAHDALEALAHARSGAHWDVVLCDVMMPSMSGLELHRQLKGERPELARRFVFITGGGYSPRVQQQLESTGLGLLEKPLDQGRLLELLQASGCPKRFAYAAELGDDTMRLALVS